MCSHYQTVKSNAQFERHFGIAPPGTGRPMTSGRGKQGTLFGDTAQRLGPQAH